MESYHKNRAVEGLRHQLPGEYTDPYPEKMKKGVTQAAALHTDPVLLRS
jgi:hypothetical protein